MRARRRRYACAAARAVAVAGAAADGAIGPARCRTGIAIGRAGIVVCAATSATIRAPPAIRPPPAVTGTATVRRRATVVSATAASTVEATATAATTVEAATAATAVEAAASSATAVTATTTLRESSRRAKQRQSCEYREDNLETSGPIHVCTLHPNTSQAMRAARSPNPFYIN